ncbi:hypothetical protein PIB30_036260 [Stylosanthes scabra]|uniref:Uncharacterized protein n=1 Tax=Stylosanthes scabra TaxID=79078 RepID=A0ABU6YC55_9FABA|nr:hypothetical protein [Stylosanthes scabra]
MPHDITRGRGFESSTPFFWRISNIFGRLGLQVFTEFDRFTSAICVNDPFLGLDRYGVQFTDFPVEPTDPILYWLSKGAREQERNNLLVNLHTETEITIEDAEGKEIKRTNRIAWRKLCFCNKYYLKLFTFIYKKDIPKACFYRTLNLKTVRSSVSMDPTHHKMKKEEEIYKVIGNANNKILPLTEAPTTTLSSSSLEKKNGKCCVIDDEINSKHQIVNNNGDKKKPISKMKELLRWAAFAKTEKGGKFNGRNKVSKFRKRGTPKEVADGNEQVSNISSFAKNGQTQIADPITTASIDDPVKASSHLANRSGNWITTDEYVVLEL